MTNLFRNPGPTNGSFLPQDYIARKSEARANLFTLTLFTLVLGAVVSAFFVTNRSWQQVSERQSEIDREYEQEAKKIDQLRALETQRAQMMEKAEITAALCEKVPRWAILGEVVLRMPKDMRLELVNLKSKRIDPPPPPAAVPGVPKPQQIKSLTASAPAGGGKPGAPAEKPRILPPQFEHTLTLTGSAERNNDIADYLAALRASPVLEGVEMQYIRESREKEHVLRKFEISARIRGNPNPEVLASSLQGLVEKRKQMIEDGMKPATERQRNANAAKEGQ